MFRLYLRVLHAVLFSALETLKQPETLLTDITQEDCSLRGNDGQCRSTWRLRCLLFLRVTD